MTNLFRNILCPICGQNLSVPVENGGQFPEVHVLPDHQPVPPVNLCAGVAITVTIDFAKCRECGANTMKHPSGLCVGCYGRKEESK